MNVQSLSNEDLVALYQQSAAGSPPLDRVSQGFDDAALAMPSPRLQAALDQRISGGARGDDPAYPIDVQPGDKRAPGGVVDVLATSLGVPSPGGNGPDLSSLSDDQLLALHERTKAQASGDGLGYNFTAGLNDALYRTAGAPVDAATWGMNKGIGGINALAGTALPEIRDPFGGHQSIADAFGHIGVRDPANVQAVSPAERIARGAGEGIGYTVGPQAALGGLARAGAVAPAAERGLAQIVGGAESTGAVAGNAIAGGSAGAGGAAAAELVPEPYKPLASLAGGLAGGGLGALAAGAPRLASAGVRVAADAMAPVTVAGRERMAGQILRDAATDPHAAADALTNPGELVPGSRPTTFQQSGDMGLGALERSVAARNPAEFMQRRADQNSARLQVVEGIQPEGNPDAVSKVFRSRLAEIDQQTDAALQAATRTAAQKARALGGTGSPEAYGDTLRTLARDAETKAREQERGLWKAVDPDGTLALPSANTKDAAVSIRKDMPSTAKPMEGEEAAIFDVAAKLKPAISFKGMAALRSRVSTLVRQEMMANGRTPVYARLSQLRGAIEHDVEGVISRRVEQEAQAVAQGAMRDEDTVAAAINRWKNAWTDRTKAETGTIGGAGGGGPLSRGTSGVSGVRGAAGETGIGPSGASGNPGLSGDDGLVPNVDEAARGRLTLANDATKARARTFDEGVNGAILRRSGSDGPYRLQNAAVPEKLFFPGGKSGENISKYRQAVGDQEALPVLQDYAVSQLRKAAETPEGMIDPRKLDVWRRRHTEALKAFPALDARLSDAGRAAEAAIESGTRRQQALDDYQTGLVGKILGAEHPDDVTRMVGSVFGRQDANALMARLVRETARDPDAVQGLRKAVMNHIMGRYVSNTEAATSGHSLLKSDQLQTFLRQNRAVLARIFSSGGIDRMAAVAEDLQRANRSIAAVKLPGGSNTTQDAFAVAKHDGPRTILAKILLASATAGGTGTAFGGPLVGAAAVLGTAATKAMRQAGIHKVEDLIRDAMLHPDRAALLLATADKYSVGRGPAVALAKRYRQASIAAAAFTLNRQDGDHEQR